MLFLKGRMKKKKMRLTNKPEWKGEGEKWKSCLAESSSPYLFFLIRKEGFLK